MNEGFFWFSAIARLACIGFVVIAGFTIPEALNLITETSYLSEGNTILIPIEACWIIPDFESSTFDGNATFTFSNLNDAALKCHSLKYFINASVASMVFAGAAIILFILFDLMSRCCAGSISRSSVAGMSLFLAFMLSQTAASTYAIYNECQFWVTFNEERFTKLEETEGDEVRTYGNVIFFLLTTIVAVACAGLLVIDSIFGLYVGTAPKRNNKNGNEQESYEASPVNSTNTVVFDSNETMGNDVATTDFTEQPTNDTNPRSWTSY